MVDLPTAKAYLKSRAIQLVAHAGLAGQMIAILRQKLDSMVSDKETVDLAQRLQG